MNYNTYEKIIGTILGIPAAVGGIAGFTYQLPGYSLDSIVRDSSLSLEYMSVAGNALYNALCGSFVGAVLGAGVGAYALIIPMTIAYLASNKDFSGLPKP